MAKLASIERITDIQPITGADNILKATVLGYDVVISKNDNLKVGDLVVFHFPDTVVDISNDVYARLKGKSRLRIIKLRGQISQGLVLPISILPKFNPLPDGNEYSLNGYDNGVNRSYGHIGCEDVGEGEDVSEDIKIIKYEAPIPTQMRGIQKGNFPSWLKMTDEDNIRSSPKVINELLNKNCYITLKYDGSSSSFAIKDNEFNVLSRRVNLLETPDNAYWKIAREYKIEEALRDTGKEYCLQGEIYGEGIQGNHLSVKGVKFAAFSLFDIFRHNYVDYSEFVNFCEKYNIPRVKEIWNGVFEFSLPDLIKKANELKYDNDLPAEGMVIRPIIEKNSEALKGRLSCKVISENFLLKYE